MTVKRIGKTIYGANLTAAEQKAVNLEFQRQLGEYDRKHLRELNAIVLWVLHDRFGFGYERLKRFYDGFTPAVESLIKRYELDDEDPSGCVRIRSRKNAVLILKSGKKGMNMTKYNAEGYSDPTAYEALLKIELEEVMSKKQRVSQLCGLIFSICDLAGFRVDGRITFVDKRTGEVGGNAN